jgi:hypothetical protein
VGDTRGTFSATNLCPNDEKLQTRSRRVWISRWKDFTQGSQFIQVDTTYLQTNISNMKFTIIATLFAALATTGVSATATATATVAADAIPAATVDETAPQGAMKYGSESNPRSLRATEPVAEAPDGGAPAMDEGTGERALGTKNGANKKDYSGQSCSLCCDDDYHC